MKTPLKKYLIYDNRNGFTYRIKRHIKRHGNFEKQNNKTRFDETTEFRQFDISAYIKFSAEFSKLRRDLIILRLGVHTKE